MRDLPDMLEGALRYGYGEEQGKASIMTENTSIKAIIYARVAQEDEPAITRQLDACRELAASRGWEVTAEFTDNGASASGFTARPGFGAMMARADSGDVDVVIAYDVTRLARNPADLERCGRAGISLATVTGGDLNLSAARHRLIAKILATVAEAEADEHAAYDAHLCASVGPRLAEYVAAGKLSQAVADELAADIIGFMERASRPSHERPSHAHRVLTADVAVVPRSSGGACSAQGPARAWLALSGAQRLHPCDLAVVTKFGHK